MKNCPVCDTSWPEVIIEYNSTTCSKCGCVLQTFHYGWEFIIDDKFFSFDESGFGNAKAQAEMDAYIKNKKDEERRRSLRNRQKMKIRFGLMLVFLLFLVGCTRPEGRFDRDTDAVLRRHQKQLFELESRIERLEKQLEKK